MKRDNWTVDKHSIRPAGSPDRCFYCNQKISQEHKKDCVIRKRTVVMDFTIRMVLDVPEFWDNEDIEFKYNDGSWCADNLIDMIDRDNKGCLCPYVTAKYIKEASEEDEDHWELVKVKELES